MAVCVGFSTLARVVGPQRGAAALCIARSHVGPRGFGRSRPRTTEVWDHTYAAAFAQQRSRQCAGSGRLRA